MSYRDQINKEARSRILGIVEERFITPRTRRARIEVAYRAAGYKSMSAFACDNGMYPATVQKIMDSTRPSVIGIYKLAAALSVSINYLTEEKY